MGPQVSNPFTQHGVRFHIRGGPLKVLEGSYDGKRLELAGICRGQEVAREFGRTGYLGGAGEFDAPFQPWRGA